MKLNASLVPAGMPAPQSPAAVPGFAQVLVPPGTTFQPLLFRMLAAVDTLKGYGAGAPRGPRPPALFWGVRAGAPRGGGGGAAAAPAGGGGPPGGAGPAPGAG